MTKNFIRIKPRKLAALESDVLPFELPIAFDTSTMQQFLESIGFKWETDNSFRVNSELKRGAIEQLKILFSLNIASPQLKPDKDDSRFSTVQLSSMSRKPFAPQPLRYGVSNGSGKHRVLSLMHPRMLVEFAYLFEEYADAILYYCNRSKFSLRHPVAKAKLVAKIDDPIADSRTGFKVRARILEDSHVPSMFKNERFNNISAFYDSAEFRACERKYTHLMKADISKCFDSIYTHSISWAIHGINTSKQMLGAKAEKSVGGKLDKYFQRSNYNETNGICIGPETSRIFAEIILQEVDVMVARGLEYPPHSLVWGKDYEVFRYVDDYFIFASSELIAERVLATIKAKLAEYKLHVNEAKTKSLELPLISSLSIAKAIVRSAFVEQQVESILDDGVPGLELAFSAEATIHFFKRALLETGEEFENLSSYFLHSLEERSQEVASLVLKHLHLLQQNEDESGIKELSFESLQYFSEIVDVALFAYSGAPTPNQSVKLCRIIILASNVFEHLGVPLINRSLFMDKIRKEIVAQLNSIRDVRSFGIHTLNLIDCLTHLGIGLTSDELADVVETRFASVDQLDAIAIMVLLRACMETSPEDGFRKQILDQIELIVADPLRETEATILKLSIPWCPFLRETEIARAVQMKATQVQNILLGPSCSLFNWEIDAEYYERLQFKSSWLVY